MYQRRGFQSQTRENNIETKNNISDKKSNTVELNSQAYILNYLIQTQHPFGIRGLRGRHRMVVRFTNTCAISAYHHWRCEFHSRTWRGVLDTTLCDKVCQWLATGKWFSRVLRFPQQIRIVRHDITEILLKVALNTNKTKTFFFFFFQGLFRTDMDNAEKYGKIYG